MLSTSVSRLRRYSTNCAASSSNFRSSSAFVASNSRTRASRSCSFACSLLLGPMLREACLGMPPDASLVRAREVATAAFDAKDLPFPNELVFGASAYPPLCPAHLPVSLGAGRNVSNPSLLPTERPGFDCHGAPSCGASMEEYPAEPRGGETLPVCANLAECPWPRGGEVAHRYSSSSTLAIKDWTRATGRPIGSAGRTSSLPLVASRGGVMVLYSSSSSSFTLEGWTLDEDHTSSLP
mmetsp:Transcript_49790/g.132047  ORF Transcript_49790/g.132047 Transcript_49790/m.132047 type:complete len:238 (+) Transcript_49790:1383-2096(+)